MENDEILFIGGLFTKSRKEEILNNSKSAIQNAANKLQWLYVKGIDKNTQNGLTVLNATFIGTYPKYYKKFLIKKKIEKNNSIKIYDVGFINLPLLVGISKYYNMKRYLKKWNNNIEQGKRKIVIAYGFFEENIRLLNYIKKLDSEVITCLIILDLPEYMSQYKPNSKYHNMINNYINHLFEKSKNKIDCYALITDAIKRKLRIKNTCITIEGMVDEEANVSKAAKKEKKDFVFMYSGGLSLEYGTEELIDSFLSIKNKDFKLWICGDGPMTKFVTMSAQKDSRISYYGLVDQEKCVKMQQEADCLVNPRLESAMTRYSFPSKMLEYFISGKPIIARMLEGFPKDYSDLFISYSNRKELKGCMLEVYNNYDKYAGLGERAQDYVLKNKNNKIQTKKLIETLKSI